MSGNDMRKLMESLNPVNEMTTGDPQSLSRFTLAYIEAALWSSSDNADEQGGEPLDKNYSMFDIDPETLTQMKADCASFQEQAWDDISDDVARAGHDFWLTRNGHGVGFWDGDWPEDVGTRLTELSKKYGEFDLYVGDDGTIYGSPLAESMDEIEELDENLDNDGRLETYTRIFMDNLDIRGIDNEAYTYKFSDAMRAVINHIDGNDQPTYNEIDREKP